MESEFIKTVNIQKTTEDYYADKAISVSGLKKLKVSPAHYKYGEEVKETEAMAFGSAYHCLILEPERFEKEYYVFDDTVVCGALIAKGAKSPRATNDYKTWKEGELNMADGKILIDKADHDHLKAMRDRLFSHPYAKMLLTGGEAEAGYAGTIETSVGAINIKFKPDYIKAGKHIVVDLKTVADASIDGFARSAADNDYHIQAAFYSDMIERMAGDNMGQTFVFIAQEKIRPYAFNLFECSPQFISQGRYEYELLLQLYKYCIDNDKWPGYQCFCNNRYGLVELNLPKYAIKSLDYYTY